VVFANRKPLLKYRYSGEYFDVETQELYLRARQYDPSTGRFISEDVAHDGANWYAYCGNDPIKFVDPSGNYSKSTKVRQQEILNPKPPAPTPAPKKPSYSNYHRSSTVRTDIIKNSPTYNPNVVGPKVNPTIKAIKEAFKKDFENFDWNNTDEQKALDSTYFSAYKGQFIIRTNWDRSGSFGIMFLSHNQDNKPYGANTVKHEYGHFLQLQELGPAKYLFGIGIPSMLNGSTKPYYSQDWEVDADVRGGVDKQDTMYVSQRHYHTPGSEESGERYMDMLKSMNGPEVAAFGIYYLFWYLFNN